MRLLKPEAPATAGAFIGIASRMGSAFFRPIRAFVVVLQIRLVDVAVFVGHVVHFSFGILVALLLRRERLALIIVRPHGFFGSLAIAVLLPDCRASTLGWRALQAGEQTCVTV